MNPAEVREALASAANQVVGVRATARFRQLVRPGDASVQLEGVRKDVNGFGWVATWRLWVLLPEDIAAAEEWIDEKALALAEALSQHMAVATAAAAQLNVGGKTLPCLAIEGNREQE